MNASQSAQEQSRNALTQMLLGASLISTSAVFVKWVQVGPTASAFWRMALGAALLTVLFVYHRVSRAEGRWWPDARPLALVALAAVFFAVDLWMWHRSILYIGVGLSTLLGNFQVFVLAGYGALMLGERTGWRWWLGLLMAMFGLVLLLAPGWSGFDARFRTGIAFGLGTAVAYAVFLLAFRKAQALRRDTTHEALLWWLCVLCAAVLGGLSLASGEPFQPGGFRDWAALLGYALIAQVIGWLVIGRAMPHLPAGIVGLCLLLQPLLAYLWDVALFGKRMGGLEWLGLGLSLAGIFLGLLRGERFSLSLRRSSSSDASS